MELVRERQDREIKIRVSRSQREEIKSLAADLGMTVTDYIRYCISVVANQG